MNSQEALCLTYKTGVSSVEHELAISKGGYNSYYYAKNILKGRFKLGEEIIIKHMYFNSVNYLMNTMGYNHE